jgi:hypothetical protein
MTAGSDHIAMRWMARALRSRLVQVMLLVLAILPVGVVAVMTTLIWVYGDSEVKDWQSKIWFVVILQVVSIGAFWAHAGVNKRLVPGELGEWALQFIVYIPFGMISYWKEHIWNKGQ